MITFSRVVYCLMRALIDWPFLHLNNIEIFQDKSDEANCEKVIFEKSYQNDIVPMLEKRQEKVKVGLSIEVMDIQDITEVDKTFQVPFTLYLSWNDGRLQYKNLHKYNYYYYYCFQNTRYMKILKCISI